MLKRLFDICASLIGLIILIPLLVPIAISIKLDSHGPIFFLQERMGRGFKPFKLIKFRTMVRSAASEGPQVTTGGDARITPMGRLLRKTKIDELPQLINVLTGDMSLVGPRPEVRKYVDMFSDEYNEVLSIKPGITDYAAIEFRDEEAVLSRYDDTEKAYIEVVLPAKIKLYKKYIRQAGFFSDTKILILTLRSIFINSEA